MINEITIENFRCYKEVSIKKSSRVNVIVGDNGSGKTALLEAIFLALGSSPEIGSRYRGQRGLDAPLSGSSLSIDRALWRDLFFLGDMNKAIHVKLKGTGEDSRSLKVELNAPRLRLVPFPNKYGTRPQPIATDEVSSGLRFIWTSARKTEYTQIATMTTQGLSMTVPGGGGQEKPHENFFYLPANLNIGSVEAATRFSELTIGGGKQAFMDSFRQEYPWIKDLSIEMNAGAGILYASVDKPFPGMRPLGTVSSGINKIVNILLCIASVENGVVLVDEVENGLHHAHHIQIWRMLLEFSKKHKTQLVLSTHSAEWLEALATAAGGHAEDISLWRVRRGLEAAEIQQFTGAQAFAAIESGGEVR